jgi:hypothetical protein
MMQKGIHQTLLNSEYISSKDLDELKLEGLKKSLRIEDIFYLCLNSKKPIYNYQQRSDSKASIVKIDSAAKTDTINCLRKNVPLRIYQGSDLQKAARMDIDMILPEYIKGVALNNALCKLMKEKKIRYAIKFAVLGSGKIPKQIYKDACLCVKYQIPIIIGAFGDSIWDMRSELDKKAVLRYLMKND